MNKVTILVFCFALIACAGRPDSQPDIYSKGERLLSGGVIDYKNDNFSAAQQKFYRALILYQSIDNSRGIQLSEINLVESLLALSDFKAAEEQLAILKQKKMNGAINDPLKYRVILLEVKMLFQKQQYRESLSVIEPLLLQSEKRGKNDNERVELLATAARLETLMNMETEHQWLDKFREVLLEERNLQPKFQVILKRINAVIATQNQQYHEALKLLHEALNYYKDQANRRAIAACLEEIAEIEFKQHNQAEALKYLKRALTIRNWLKDQYHIEKINKRIMQVHHL